MSEFFSGMDVADVDLHEGNRNSCESIAQRHAGVSKTARVDNDELGFSTSLVDPVDDGSFVVGLEVLNLDSQVFALRSCGCHDIRERGAAVHLWLSRAQKVEVGAVDDED